MTNKWLLFVICTLELLFSASVYAYQKKDLVQQLGDREKVKSTLVMNQEWVKYPAYNDRPGWNTLLGDDKTNLIKKGEEQLHFQWKVVTASDYLAFSQNGSRVVMENPHNENLNAISSLFWAEMAEGKGRFIPKIIDGVFYMCEKTTWILSAHMYLQTIQKQFPDHREDIIDLSTGYCGAMLSWIYYFLHNEFDKVTPVISIRLKTELEKRVLKPYMERSDFWWQAFNVSPETMVNNWNPWCNSNVLQCFMLLEKDKDRLADAVARTMRSVDSFFNYTHSDGACEEGPSYWDGAAGMAFIYLQLLSDVSSGELNLFHHPMVKNMGEFIVSSYIGDGWGVNFADASAKLGGNYPLIYEYGKAVNSRNMQAMAAHLNNHKFTAGTDIRRALQYYSIRKELDEAPDNIKPSEFIWYPETEFCYMSDNKGNFFAAKGGHNAESHNHNDIGSFIYCIDKMPVIIDAGVGTYTAKTFSSQRYSIWTMQSQYHNLPTINGVSQQEGRSFKAKNVNADKSKNRFRLDLSNAYPKEAKINKWIREYQVEPNRLVIKENYELSEYKAPNEIHFMAWGTLNTSVSGKIFIEVNGRKAVLNYDGNKFDVEMESINLDDAKLTKIWGNKIYRITLKSKVDSLKDKYSFTINKL